MDKSFAALTTVGSGSYRAEDVSVLLQPVQVELTEVQEKERLIQTRQKHYSEMISLEQAPSELHHALYEQALTRNGKRMAAQVQALALGLNNAVAQGALVLVSFVRAGLPLGVLLRRALSDLGREVHHYGISIVRDRGVDHVALDAIIQAHGTQNIVFVDGWTGKGAISAELERSLQGDLRFASAPRLAVLADPCGAAWLAACAEDWVIPSGILGATVSGLVSRSIWPVDGGLHGCVLYEHLREHDLTCAFVERIDGLRKQLGAITAAIPWNPYRKQILRAQAQAMIDTWAQRFAINNRNRLKPGIAEATRAVLRRVPERVLVRDHSDGDVQLLLHLTQRAGIVVEEVGAQLGPYRAMTVIRSLSE